MHIIKGDIDSYTLCQGYTYTNFTHYKKGVNCVYLYLGESHISCTLYLKDKDRFYKAWRDFICSLD